MNLTLDKLIEEGYKENPHFYIGAGFFYCPTCGKYQYHTAYSRISRATYVVCKVCKIVNER